ncbi:c-type cytochrome [Pyxidicoccus fallax]|uniref:Cytochrome c n=1 Tax=Pyxidicoccus fallax TaxID=394095 RepID=A0A848LSH5_9BACT|nr:c-type cytochrome [Pyxidicoccus fallax]NMO20641.1 cytochrome c [Pyxidicoccus fallax]NPC81417.1 c-type cytochrome [Pyxidicoccus fallax]
MRTQAQGGRPRPAHRFVPVVQLLAMLSAPAALAQGAPQGAQLFTQRCASCHSVGEGDRVGPDLHGVLERRDEAWVTRFIQSPGSLIDAGDPVANELLKKFNGIRMPDQSLNDTERASLYAFFRDCAAKGKGACKPSPAAKMGTDATQEEVARGRRLFEGSEPLTHGGPACIGCHDVRGIGVAGGGTLGPNLTFAFARKGERGLTPLLAKLDTPLMAPLYAKAPLTEEEQYAVKAYLADASRDGGKPRQDRDFFYLGIVGLAVALGFIGLVWGPRGKDPHHP